MTPSRRRRKFRRITQGSRKSLASGLARLAWSSNGRRRSSRESCHRLQLESSMLAVRPGRTRYGSPNRGTRSISLTPLRAWWKRRGGEARRRQDRSRRCQWPMVAGLRNVSVLGVEGRGWILQDFDTRWEDAELRKDLLDVARALESESSVVGVSAHLLGIGWKQ